MPALGDLLDFLPEPILFLTVHGAIVQANTAAVRLFGRDPTGLDLSALVSSPPADLATWLRHCSGTAAPLVGSLALTKADGIARRFRTHGARLPGAGAEVRIVVRLTDQEFDQFSLLKRQVEQLNAESRERLHKQAVLEEALRHNEMLLRELNHRVKNNLQMMVALFSAAVRETESPEVKRVLRDACNRLLAVGAAQDLMYQTSEMEWVPALPFMEAIARTLVATVAKDVPLELSAAEGRLSNENAFPLALILNELVTNAVKHGVPDGRGTIRVELTRRDDEYALAVHDSGPGITVTGSSRATSGLGLVRGLCRQIGGRLLVANDGGARIEVQFTEPQLG